VALRMTISVRGLLLHAKPTMLQPVIPRREAADDYSAPSSMCRDTADGLTRHRFSRPFYSKTRFDRPLRLARSQSSGCRAASMRWISRSCRAELAAHTRRKKARTADQVAATHFGRLFRLYLYLGAVPSGSDLR